MMRITSANPVNRKICGWLVMIVLFFSACASPRAHFEPVVPVQTVPKLNLDEVQSRLGIGMEANKTGYQEVSFDACNLGQALQDVKPPLKDCHHAYFVLIQFQLSCREEEETASVLTENDLRPVAHRHLEWRVGGGIGTTDTDSLGFAQARMLASHSLKKASLRISTGTDFLNMKASDASAIVTPPSWCMP